MRKRAIAIILLLAISFSLGAAGDVYRSNLEVKGNGSIRITSDAPDITIDRHAGNSDVRVELTGAGRDHYRMTVREDRDGVYVEVKKKQRFSIGLGMFQEAHLSVSLPSRWTEGDLEVASVSGSIRLETDLEAEEISLGSVSGSINFKSMATTDAMEIESVSGAVKGERIEAAGLEISSVSGAVLVDDITVSDGEDMHINTVSGAIRVGALEAKHIYLESISGAIQAPLPAHFSGKVTASSLSGAINTEISSANSSWSDKRTHGFSIGTGNATFEASTTSGAIRITQ